MKRERIGYNGIRAPRQEAPFLYSFVNFAPLLRHLVTAVRPRIICEVGVESPLLIRLLVELSTASESEFDYVAIDPSLEPATVQEIEERGGQVVKLPSSEGIPSLQRKSIDLFLIDGDHNYVTVTEDLRNIERHFDAPLVVLHDVCWPTDRRDAYYFPSHLPPEEIAEHTTQLGLRPFQEGLFESGGLMGSPVYAWRTLYGGPRNGVLTAVEDFIASASHHWELQTIPGFFGLGLLYQPPRCTPALKDCLNRFRTGVNCLGEVIEILEYERLREYCLLQNRESELQVARETCRKLAGALDEQRNAAQQARSALAELAAKRDRQQLATESTIRRLRRTSQEAMAALHQIKGSRFWRLSWPLRLLSRTCRSLAADYGME